MATIRQFEEILAWEKGRELVREVYRVTRAGEFLKDYSSYLCNSEIKGAKLKTAPRQDPT